MSDQTVIIKVPGEPTAQPRQRYTRTGINYVQRSHPVHGFKETLRLLARDRCEYHADGVVVLEIEAVFTRPKYMTKKRGVNHRVPHTKKPDADNVGKAVMDALNGVAYRDDSQVWLSVRKWIAAGGEEPHTVVSIRTFYECKGESCPIYLAIEKVEPFAWPEWLLCDWIAKDASDDWYGWNGDAPIIVPNCRVWYPDGFYLDPAIVDTSVFPHCDWERSLFRRLNNER